MQTLENLIILIINGIFVIVLGYSNEIVMQYFFWQIRKENKSVY